ncbi:DUF1622 domain-containing protein [Georgenia muralis]|uniref:Putative membrane protein n=1 Tax=Georgenia muralis TaxID=154117 RepID=A0A3N4Z4Q9_9MICO|nr:DUF1622 domain-containing protein [Georgenia muralis]RPF28299.1 putative membrane protein [Georgenia muralis]
MSEELLRQAVDWLVRLIEAASAVVVGAGALTAFVLFLTALVRRDTSGFVRVRLLLGRFLALGLEFQLASDILTTAVAPTFEEIGKLAAVATIRTALNYFLAREIRTERRELEETDTPTDQASPS